jgi:asparagine synthase (glutamine-hydrolysing)
MSPEQVNSILCQHGTGPELAEAVFGPLFAGQTQTFDLDRTLRADLVTWLPDDLLTKVDRASMAVGLECRVPYLDHRLVELALRIPAEEKAGLFFSKRVFKRAVAGRVPAAILHRKKAGFTLPLDAWFRHELRPLLLDRLAPARLAEEGLFEPRAVQAMIKVHLAGRENLGHPLFSLLIFQLWQDSMKA